MNNYDDIINLPHYESKIRKRMSLEARSAQFAPFAALTGYDNKVKETARLTDKKIELTDEEYNLINSKLQIIKDHIKEQPEIIFTIFIKDKLKDGGKYEEIISDCLDELEPFIDMVKPEEEIEEYGDELLIDIEEEYINALAVF